MPIPEIFPAAKDDGCEPFRQISKNLDCAEYLVLDAFRGVNVPEWDTPEHLDTVRATTQAFNEAERHARNLLINLRKLSPQEIESLIQVGCVTIPQIEHLALTLERDYKSLDEWSRNRYRAGGRNPAAYEIAEGMRRTFRRLRLKITYGVNSDSAPSTDFTRAVKHALEAFGVKANFRGPAREACDKQRTIGNRLQQCAFNKREKNRTNANSKSKK